MEQVIGFFTGALLETQLDEIIALTLHTNRQCRDEAWEIAQEIKTKEEKVRQEDKSKTPEQNKYSNSSPVPNQPFSNVAGGMSPTLSTSQINLNGIASITESISKEDTTDLSHQRAQKAQ